MTALAEAMGDALAWAPALGFLGGPELGPCAVGRRRRDRGTAYGNLMFGTVVFADLTASGYDSAASIGSARSRRSKDRSSRD